MFCILAQKKRMSNVDTGIGADKSCGLMNTLH